MAAKTKLLPIRGIMFDPARLIERYEFYFDLLPHLARWGINTILWHFFDDEGVLLKLETHPELATPHAFSKTKMRRFIRTAAEVGIDVIPEVECLGHARAITSLPQYSHLADGGSTGFNACCPSHPDTLSLYGDIIREVAELFGSQYFHAGLDEVDLSGCRRCRSQGRGKAHWWLYARHTAAIHRIVADCGKRMIMWADHVENDPGMLKRLPADIILAHWEYHEVRPERITPSLDDGRDVILAPALCKHSDVICPNAADFQNMDEMTALAGRLVGRGVIGLINTWWAPYRGLRDAYLPAIAYTGWMLQKGGGLDKIEFLRRFLADYHGLRDIRAARALCRLHGAQLRRLELRALCFDSPADMHAAVGIAGGDDFAERLAELRACAEDLAAAAPKVKARRGAFRANVLAARVAAAVLENGQHLALALKAYEQAEDLRDKGATRFEVLAELGEVAELLSAVQKSTDDALDMTGREWDRTRYRDDPKKMVRNAGTKPCKTDWLLGRLARSSLYSRGLRTRLRRSVSSYRRGGPFPVGL